MNIAQVGVLVWGAWFLLIFLLTHQPLALIMAFGFLALFVVLRHH